MKIIAQNYQEDKAVSDSINNFFKTYKISSILRAANAYKKKGIAVTSIFRYLFSLIFTQRSMYMNMLMGKNSSGFSKDTVYRFLKSFHINWLRFTSLLCARIVSESIENLTDINRVNVLIVDDSMMTPCLSVRDLRRLNCWPMFMTTQKLLINTDFAC